MDYFLFGHMTHIQDFSNRASSFDTCSKWVMDEMINSIPCQLLKDLNKNDNILDAGGGTGYLSSVLVSNLNVPPSHITIVDSCEGMLILAKKRLPNARCVCQSIESFCENSDTKYNVILLRQVLHYVDDVEHTIKALKHCLEPDGKLYIGQFVLLDSYSFEWHDKFMHAVSISRKRSFELNSLMCFLESLGFIIDSYELCDYQDSVSSFYQRRQNNNLDYNSLLKVAMDSLNTKVVQTLRIKQSPNDISFTIPFCHMLLKNRK